MTTDRGQPAPPWDISRAAVLDARVVNLTRKGFPPIAATRRKIHYFQPADVVLECQVEFGEWNLKRVEATGLLCQSDGEPVPDSDDTHIHSWLTPLRSTRANPDGVPDWVVTLGRRYMPGHLNDPTTEQ